MDECIVRIPKSYLNPETVATTRLNSLLFVLIHRLDQVITSHNDSNTYPSLYHYRQAASRRGTYHVSLLKCKRIFEKELENMKRPVANTPSTPINPNRRRNPTRRRVDGALLEEVQFAASLPYKTPKRKIIQFATAGDEENAPPEIYKMVKDCTGMIMKSHPIQYQRCNLCSKQTPWYCPGCKRWLCMDRKALQDNQKELNLYCHNVRGNEVIFNKTCFHKSHEAAWERNKTKNGRN